MRRSDTRIRCVHDGRPRHARHSRDQREPKAAAPAVAHKPLESAHERRSTAQRSRTRHRHTGRQGRRPIISIAKIHDIGQFPCLGMPRRLLRWLSQRELKAVPRSLTCKLISLSPTSSPAPGRCSTDRAQRPLTLGDRGRHRAAPGPARRRRPERASGRDAAPASALMPSSGGSSVQFAELLLQSGRTAQLEPAATLQEQERRSSQRLGELIDALERLAERDGEAARRS